MNDGFANNNDPINSFYKHSLMFVPILVRYHEIFLIIITL